MHRGEWSKISLAAFAVRMPSALRHGLGDCVIAANAVTVRKSLASWGADPPRGGQVPCCRLDRPHAQLCIVENAGLMGQSQLLRGNRLIGS